MHMLLVLSKDTKKLQKFQAFSSRFRQYIPTEKLSDAAEMKLRFEAKIFCLTVPKNFVGEPFCAVFQKISGSQKVYG